MLKSELEHIVLTQSAYFINKEFILERTNASLINYNLPRANIITGVRRSGKSTLMKSILSDIGDKTGYLHFDDPRLNNFEVADFYKLESIWIDKTHFQFDEIHKVRNWEQYIRHAVERKKKIIITGSNANLLSRELATLLTGRHSSFELFPFSFQEYIRFRKYKPGIRSFNRYLDEGGFPEFLQYNITNYHQELLVDIIQKDIAVRNGIRNISELQNVILHLINNVSRLTTYSKLSKTYQIKSVNTVIDYINMYEAAYLLFTIPMFSPSVNKQIRNPKKAYTIDSAIIKYNSFKAQRDAGRILENMVFLQLRRSYKEINYFIENGECDFIVKSNNEIFVIQSCWEVTDSNMDREVNGMLGALDYFSLKEGIIVTYNQKDILIQSGKKIYLIPFYEWAKD